MKYRNLYRNPSSSGEFYDTLGLVDDDTLLASTVALPKNMFSKWVDEVALIKKIKIGEKACKMEKGGLCKTRLKQEKGYRDWGFTIIMNETNGIEK